MPRAQGLPHALRPPPCSRVVRPGRLQLCAGYKSPAAAADCRLEMRPKERGQSCAGDRPRPGLRPGDLTAVASAPRPAASPAPEPSAKSGPASAQAPGVGQGAGSGCRFVSEAPTGARPASEVGVKGNAQSRPGTSDAPWTRFVFQGPFGPRATGLGTGKAADIWKSPAAYIGRRPGVSGPERAAFIRELEEALCPNLPRTIKKITPEDIKVMLYLLEERERDLNTAARIGQSLVKQNSILMEQNSKLEAMLGSAREEILHLRHQVNLRDDLLQLYSDSDDEEEEEDEEEDEEEGEWEEEQQHDQAYEVPQTASQEEPLHYCPQLEALQKRLRVLEEENDQLREEASHLDTLEDEEQMLILECVEQFSEASQQMAQLSEVLVLRLENYERQQKEVTQLQAQVVKLQQRCQSYGAETEKLQQQLASEKEIQMQLQEELQELREKYPDGKGRLVETREEVKTLCQQPPVSTGSITHYAYSMSLETLAEELRTSLQRVISDPVYFTQRNYGRPRGETSDLSEEREQEQGFEAEEGLIPGEDFVPAEELEPEEELRATEEVEAEEGLMDEGELVSEETEAWEEVEPELDEATRMNVVTSALEASGLGPSHLDMKYVLQQLTNWQDAHYRQQLRQKVVQKGECSHRGLTPASQTSCRLSSR
ncbi:huntingtin-associated protein 1 isoform X2 [Nycticebus coucang]|uniref:huntingtin-associated protein 1 isoform X2 n=1 Tax=Nycticebus coucang TaxID=9470 RepID=UPI00234CE662|nr:huntingtin-associated protein 1 isoform X2 [Nycticebus coucang]